MGKEWTGRRRDDFLDPLDESLQHCWNGAESPQAQCDHFLLSSAQQLCNRHDLSDVGSGRLSQRGNTGQQESWQATWFIDSCNLFL